MEQFYIPQRSTVDNIAGRGRDIYDVAVHGGLQEVIKLPLVIPAYVTITQCIIVPVTPMVGAANIELGLVSSDGAVGAADNLLASTAAPSITAPTVAKELADLFELTAETQLQLTVSAADLTEGKFFVYLDWVGGVGDISPLTV